MDTFITLIILFVGYIFLKNVFSKKEKPKPVPVNLNPYIPNPEYTTRMTSERPNGKPATWYKKNESVVVQGYEIPGGLIYVGEVLSTLNGRSNDACLINPKLKALRADTWEAGEEMGYWPEYANIPNRCRGAYLQWLSTGRSDPKAYIGYVFLFLYGLERRLILDGQRENLDLIERNEIVDEIRNLILIYGNRSAQGGDSFSSYANNLLAAEWALYRSDDGIVPEYINFEDKYRSQAFQLLLAKHVSSKKPIPAAMALKWVSLQEDYWLKTPARRCNEEFEEMFNLKYEHQFGDGMRLTPNKTKLKFEYRAASPSLGFVSNLKIPDLPNPFVLKGSVHKLIEIAEDCSNELDAYSRFIGRKGNDPASFSAFALLPKELISKSPNGKKIKAYVEESLSSKNNIFPVKIFYELVGEQPPIPFNKKDAESLALFVESLGFGMAPDIRFHNSKLTTEDMFCIFQQGHGVNFKPSREFHTISAIIRLGSMVSQSDKNIAPAEDMMMKELIMDNRELTNIEKDSLMAFLHWCLRTPQSNTGLKQQLANVSPAEKASISRILIGIAQADGQIDPREIKQIEKLYTSLGLDKENVIGDIHSLSASNQLITMAIRDPDQSFKIPGAPENNIVGFRLNEELVRIRKEETLQVKGVLENIFSDEEGEYKNNPPKIANSNSGSPLQSLDEAHQRFFNKIISQDTWQRETLYQVCKEMGLMVDGAMEVLNEWAFENANAPLLDDGDPIYVDVELAKEIMNA